MIDISRQTYQDKKEQKPLQRTASQPRHIHQPTLDKNYILRSLGRKPKNTYYKESLDHYAPPPTRKMSPEHKDYGNHQTVRRLTSILDRSDGSHKTIPDIETGSPQKAKPSGKTTMSQTRNNSLIVNN